MVFGVTCHVNAVTLFSFAPFFLHSLPSFFSVSPPPLALQDQENFQLKNMSDPTYNGKHATNILQ